MLGLLLLLLMGQLTNCARALTTAAALDSTTSTRCCVMPTLSCAVFFFACLGNFYCLALVSGRRQTATSASRRSCLHRQPLEAPCGGSCWDVPSCLSHARRVCGLFPYSSCVAGTCSSIFAVECTVQSIGIVCHHHQQLPVVGTK